MVELLNAIAVVHMLSPLIKYFDPTVMPEPKNSGPIQPKIEQKAPQPAPAPLEQRPQQIIINNNNTTHKTTIEAIGTNKIIYAPSTKELPVPEPPAPPPVVKPPTPATAPPPQPPVHQPPVHQPAVQQPAIVPSNITNPMPLPVDVPKPQQPLAENVYNQLYDQLKELYTQHYGKAALTVAVSAYVYLLYRMIALNWYLTDSKRISLWFSEYSLSRLLGLDLGHMSDLITQEFISTYHVCDQKSLKEGTMRFLDDLDSELRCLEWYDTLTNRIQTISSIGQTCCSPCTYALRTVIPFTGVILDSVPTLNNILYVNTELKKTLGERISRIHYYKNIFLQSTIFV